MTLFSQDEKLKEWENTWTYTYLKAKENQRLNLKSFVIKNWFAMDSVAVKQGLFNDYMLLENADTSPNAQWDYVVAVEYYTKGTYSDIQEEWAVIRKNHQAILIEGLSFPDLGAVIKSENLTQSSGLTSEGCKGDQFEVLRPFLGQWHEYLVEDGEQQLYGKLSIELSSGCSLKKNFSMLTSGFSYETLGYFDSQSDTWKETYTFSNGGYAIYEWKVVNDEVVLQMVESSFRTEGLRRNRWTNVEEDSFEIISEESMDGGRLWKTTSVTKMQRIGKQ